MAISWDIPSLPLGVRPARADEEALDCVYRAIVEATCGSTDEAAALLERARVLGTGAGPRVLRVVDAARSVLALGAHEPRASLVVSSDGRWFAVDGKPRVSLGRAGAPCRILSALVARRQSTPSVPMPWQELFEHGWPDTRIGAQSCKARVYSAIWALRRLGLEGLVITVQEGYLLDPARVTVSVVTAPSTAGTGSLPHT